MDTLSKKLRDRIYDLRENKEMSFATIAKELNLTERMVGKYCRKYITPFIKKDKTKDIKTNHLIGNTYSQNRKTNPMYTDEQIAEIIEKILEWAYSSDEIYIAGFLYREFKRSKTWLYKLADHHPELHDALETVKTLIARKIGNHSFIGDRNSTFGEKILPMYCKEYKALKEWQANLAKQSADEIKATADEVVKAIKDDRLLDLLKQDDKKK